MGHQVVWRLQDKDGSGRKENLRPALPGVLVQPIPTSTPVGCWPAGNSTAPEPALVLYTGSAVGPAQGPGKGLGGLGEWGHPRCFWESTGVWIRGAGIALGWWVPSPFSLPSSFYFFPELSLLIRGAEQRLCNMNSVLSLR